MIDMELLITRIFNASVEKVWNAWTEPDQIKKWWGPKNFTSPFCKIDFHVNGKYLFCMQSPEGQNYWSTGVYHEIVSKERIVYTDSFSDENGNIVPATYYGMSNEMPVETLVTVTLEKLETRTKMTLMHLGLPPGTHRDLAEQGWNESFDKLEESLK